MCTKLRSRFVASLIGQVVSTKCSGSSFGARRYLLSHRNEKPAGPSDWLIGLSTPKWRNMKKASFILMWVSSLSVAKAARR
jgi:hypothetical protein